MDLIRLVNSVPVWFSGLLFLIVGGLLFPVGQLVVRMRFGVDSLINNNEVAGFKYAVLGVVYAVLLVFITVVVWDEYRAATSNVAQETRAIRDLHRLSFALKAEERMRLHDDIVTYMQVVVAEEWPAMARRSESPEAEAALSRLFDTLLNVTEAAGSAQSIRQSALDLMIEIADSRRRRLDSADGAIPAVLWCVIFFGGTVTMSFTWFFGARNAFAQAAMTSMLGLTIVTVIYVSALMDLPFSGQVSVGPLAFENALAFVENRSNSSGAQTAWEVQDTSY